MKRLIGALRAIALSFGFPEQDVDDIVQDAFIRVAKATWDWTPSKAYLKKAVLSAGEKFMNRRPKEELLADFQAIEAYDDDDDTWPIKGLYYTRSTPEGYEPGDPLDLVDFLAAGFDVFDEPVVLGDVEWEVLTALTNARPEPEAQDLPSLEVILSAFTEKDRALLEDWLYDGMSLRDLAAKYGLSKSTLQRRLKNIEKAFASKRDDVLAKPSRQKKKSRKKRTSGTRKVIVARRPEPIPA